MLILKNGGSAVDAVEAAIKTLEDREITNAGYGSNLAMDGVVECDAAIVDHHGRSGAVGAVAQIKNPISLARLVHKHSMHSLTLRRVPPNLLVAQGATEFAVEMGMPILPHDALVSPAAKERWLRWRADLRAAERKGRISGNHPSCWKVRSDVAPEDEILQNRIREQHTEIMLRDMAPAYRSPSLSDENLYFTTENNSATPSDPSLFRSERSSGSWRSADRVMTTDTSDQPTAPETTRPQTITESSRSAFINSTQKVPTIGQYKGHLGSQNMGPDAFTEDTEMEELQNGPLRTASTPGHQTWADGSSEDSGSASSSNTMKAHHSKQPLLAAVIIPLPVTSPEKEVVAPTPLVTTPLSHVTGTAQLSPGPGTFLPAQPRPEEDYITDTVGAIAVDSWGNIACGASSGGIGMKYRGRVGPAALVGVGAAVIPTNPDDPEQACVATVTSGTGEHMATTMAATVCAERLYQGVKKSRGGEYVEVSEDEALKAMIENDFMGHPSVKNSNSAGAIGILGLKKISGGMLLYFGHNTDSFAMASMSSDDLVPKCTMSRSKGGGQIAQGGRMLPLQRIKRAKSTQRYR
ncbi:nucleophile aminohydrolase [Ampelomyces quisqualis]|uniref:Nucleophile aminohydrolase n=1 Tax=Ampelomyces quisqualis TaxID=50730 RepID=A0A6A5QIB2_AMPQU|nr:nucleophile aminohydrolase [Ampelomyces quisqualis]